MPPFPAEKSSNRITTDALDQIVANVKHLFLQASSELGVPPTVKVEVHSEFTHVPNSGVKLLFKAQVHTEHDVCEGTCTGSLMSDSSQGWIYSQTGKGIYGS